MKSGKMPKLNHYAIQHRPLYFSPSFNPTRSSLIKLYDDNIIDDDYYGISVDTNPEPSPWVKPLEVFDDD